MKTDKKEIIIIQWKQQKRENVCDFFVLEEWAIFVYSGFPGTSAKLRLKLMHLFISRASMPCPHQSYRTKGNHGTGTHEIIPVFQFNYSVIFSFHTALHFHDSIIFLHCARGFQLGKTTQTKETKERKYWCLDLCFTLRSSCRDTFSFYQKTKYIYVICRPGGPYWEKLSQRSWVRPEAAGRGPYSRPRAQFFPIRTDLGRQITCLLFYSVGYFVRSFSVDFSLQPFSICFSFLEGRFPRQDNKIHFRYDSCRYLNP